MSIQQNIQSDLYRMADMARTPQQIQSLQQHITASIKDGAVQSYVGVPLLQSLNQRLKQAQMMAQGQQGQQLPQGAEEQPAIADQIMEEAQQDEQPGGVDQLPSNLYGYEPEGQQEQDQEQGQEEGYRGGGIVAFADEGQVRDPELPKTAWGIDLTQPPPPEVPYEERLVPRGIEYLKKLVGPIWKSQAMTGVQSTPTKVSPNIEDEGIRGVLTSEQAAASSLTPGSGNYIEDESGRGIVTPEQAAAAAASKSTPPPLSAGIAGVRPAVPGTPQPTAGETAVQPALSMMDTYTAMLEKQGDETKKEREQAKWTALLMGGLGVAGGTSPNALANLSAGALPAIQEYNHTMAGLRKEDAQRLEKLMAAGVSKEKFKLEARKLDISDKRADQMYDVALERNGILRAQVAASGAGKNEKMSYLEEKQLEGMELKARQEVSKLTKNMYDTLAKRPEYGLNQTIISTSKDPAKIAKARAAIEDTERPFLADIEDARAYADIYARKRDPTGGSSGSGSAPRPMPKSAAEAEKGQTYNTPHGLAVWNGQQFVPVK